MPKRMQDLPEEYEVSRRTLGRAIGDRMRQRRAAMGITQEQLRTRIEVQQVYISRTQFSRIETGETLPDAAQLIALCAVLNVSFQWLLLGEGQPPAK